MTRRSLLLFLLVFVLQVFTFTLRAHYWVSAFGLVAVIAAWMLIFYRRYVPTGILRLENETVTTGGEG